MTGPAVRSSDDSVTNSSKRKPRRAGSPRASGENKSSSFLLSFRRKTLGPLVTLIFTLLTTALTPLGERIKLAFKQERVSVYIIANKAPVLGRLWPLRFALASFGGSDNSGGTISLSWQPNNAFCTNDGLPINQPITITVPQFSGLVDLPPTGQLQLNTCGSADGTITARFTTSKNKSDDFKTLPFHPTKIGPLNTASVENLSGVWWIRLYREKDQATIDQGHLRLDDQAGELSGRYELRDTGDVGSIIGHHDSKFDVEFTKLLDPVQWRLHSEKVESKNGFLVVEGSAQQVRQDGSEVRIVQALKFTADARALGQIAWGREDF